MELTHKIQMIFQNNKLVLLSLLVIMRCSYDTDPISIRTNNQMFFHQDSAYIEYTVKEFIKCNYQFYAGYDDIEDKNKIDVFVDMILYDKEGLKLFAFVILKLPPRRNYNFIAYDARAIAGFREKNIEKWIIYPFPYYFTARIGSYDKASFLIRRYYSFTFYKASEYVKVGKSYVKEDFEYRKFNTSIVDTNFWNSIVWQKDLRVKGFYNFQTQNYLWSGNPIVPYLRVNYPDSILKLYN